MDVEIQDLIDRTMEYHMEGIDQVHIPYYEWHDIRRRLTEYYKPLSYEAQNSYNMKGNEFLFNGIKFVAIIN